MRRFFSSAQWKKKLNCPHATLHRLSLHTTLSKLAMQLSTAPPPPARLNVSGRLAVHLCSSVPDAPCSVISVTRPTLACRKGLSFADELYCFLSIYRTSVHDCRGEADHQMYTRCSVVGCFSSPGQLVHSSCNVTGNKKCKIWPKCLTPLVLSRPRFGME